MTCTQRIYQRTAAGARACQRSVSGWPEGCRRVLQHLRHPATVEEIAQRLPGYSACAVPNWLHVLEKMGLVESVAVEWMEELIALGYHEPEPMRMQI